MLGIVNGSHDAEQVLLALNDRASTMSEEQKRSLASVVIVLKDIHEDGFVAIKDACIQCRRSELWIFHDGLCRASLKVPGDGRRNTHDVCVVDIELLDEPPSDHSEFEERSVRLLQGGIEKRWE